MGGLKPSQRDRLIGAMTTVAARYGYGGASVARVVEQAGVSRATFYAHFADREECFLAAYERIIERVERDLGKAERLGLAGRRREAIHGVLAATERDPAAARVVLIEALAAPPAARAVHERLLDRVEEHVDRALTSDENDAPTIELPARALIGGVANLLAIRVFQGETSGLANLLDDLEVWMNAYALPAGHRRRDRLDWARLSQGLKPGAGAPAPERPPAAPLPRGRAALPANMAAGEQRQRIINATAGISTEKGYAEMTVADIVAAAGVAREVFYEQFRNKEEASLAAQALGLQESLALAAGQFFKDGGWCERVWDAAEAMLGYISQHVELAAVHLVESYAAGPAAIRRTFDSRMAYTLFLEDGYRQRPEAERLPRLCSEATAGAMLELLRRQAALAGTERMSELLPQAVHVAIAPFVGTARASEFIEARVAAARKGS